MSNDVMINFDSVNVQEKDYACIEEGSDEITSFFFMKNDRFCFNERRTSGT